MSSVLDQVRSLAKSGKVVISLHGALELANDDILATEAIFGLTSAVVVEDYPDAKRGPTILTLQITTANEPIHVVWGIKSGTTEPAVLITAYRPDALEWDETFTRRRTQ